MRLIGLTQTTASQLYLLHAAPANAQPVRITENPARLAHRPRRPGRVPRARAAGAARRGAGSRRLPASIPLLAVNALSDDAARQLAPWLGVGQTLVLLGSSGAGKSTLTNTLTQAGRQTGRVRKGDGRGPHTTTSRSLHLCVGGACIIDTPGLRSWRPDADQAGLTAAFEDIDALAAQSRFRDCRHAAEPGCAVRGAVDESRLLNYHKLLREARRSQQTPPGRIAEVVKWKVMQRAAAARSKDKLGKR